ncbi:MAG: hypothetical protein EHM33_00870 [Chloroflexi bacterium]|nr:MAG: hypothetical protein EHM33_00870 [Chloroflexota bacterium]
MPTLTQINTLEPVTISEHTQLAWALEQAEQIVGNAAYALSWAHELAGDAIDAGEPIEVRRDLWGAEDDAALQLALAKKDRDAIKERILAQAQ